MTFHQLEWLSEATPESLYLPRTRAILAAFSRNADYTLVGVRSSAAESQPRSECIIVDVRCDGVPTLQNAGILYQERLALVETDGTKSRLEVLTMRIDFPILMHQNHVPPGYPGSLCLYNETELAVRRSWTPESFLRRIQWWLERSARGTLHAADQPAEQLFFMTKYELLLPPDFSTTGDAAREEYMLAPLPERSDGGQTFKLVRAESDRDRSVVVVSVVLPPILHGVVEPMPDTLGSLADTLRARGADLTMHLRQALLGVIADGSSAQRGTTRRMVALLLTTPITRAADESPSLTNIRAYLVDSDLLDLGLNLGAFIEHDGSFFRGTGVPPDPLLEPIWRRNLIWPLEVMKGSLREDLRVQSGISTPGPRAVLVGAGSLGSALLNMWVREGWGDWTVVDKDHVRPHNLSRHTALHDHIGQSKADVVAELAQSAFPGVSNVKGAVMDVNPLCESGAVALLAAAELIIDASTDIDFPRATSFQDELPRLASTFISSDGQRSVLLLEDANRTIRLRSLESQYYRALIKHDFGAVDDAREMRTFWSGASCRDISLVLPYSRVMGHASTLVEQIPEALSSDVARISIWKRKDSLGAVVAHDFPVYSEKIESVGDYQVSIDAGLLDDLQTMRSACLPHETGGVLLGYHDFNLNMIVIVAALPAPPDSQAGPTFFVRGSQGCFEAVETASRQTDGMVRYIGEWHSHPDGHSSQPSPTDIIQLQSLAHSMQQDGLPVIQLIVAQGQHSIAMMSHI